MKGHSKQTDSSVDSSAHPLREVWGLAWPTVVTMTSYTVMQFVDKFMVAKVGPLEVAAQGNGGIWTFAPIAVALGVLTVVNTYVSQNLGAKTPENGPKYAWASVWISVMMWVLFLLPFAVILPWVFGHMHDPEAVQEVDRLIEMESGYGRILLVGGVVLMIGRGMHHYFFGLHRPKVITVAAIIGNVFNIIANYILIFGAFGIPAMGLYGAAVGTVLGTAVELMIPAAIFLGPKMNREFMTRSHWLPQWKPIREILKIGWPAGVQFGNELFCWSVFMTILVGTFGENHMTAGWIALTYMHLSFMPAVGVSVAASSLVGRYIGAGQPDIAAARARLCVLMTVCYMSVCALIFFIFRYPLVELFVSESASSPEQVAEIVSIGVKLMVCAAIFQTMDAIGIVYSGALRGAGDTVWPAVVTMALSWMFIIGLGWLMIQLFPELESVGPWIGASVYIIALSIMMWRRFNSGAWRKIDLLARTDLEHAAAQVAPVSPGPPASDPDAAIRDFAESEGSSAE